MSIGKYLILFLIAVIIGLPEQLINDFGTREDKFKLFKRGNIEVLIFLVMIIITIALVIGKHLDLLKNKLYWIVILFIMLSFVIVICQKQRKKNILLLNGKVVYARTKTCEIIHGKNVEWYEFTSYVVNNNSQHDMVVNEYKCLVRDLHCTYRLDMEKIVNRGVFPDMKVYVDPEDENKYFVDKTEYFRQVLDYNRQIMEA
ncbi:MAG: hypothetical protein IJV15_05595 [Lachnospiraceae bacterium]|nr:hypothetical protein [Lachnospiraceae bacterium]